MAQEGFKRKLTAILSADAVGYSRLMAEDETATVKTIASYREIMASLIKQHRGRVVDSPGDNLLAEFSSVVDAVQCAVAVQNEFQTRNAELAENRRMEFRIGINLGDVIDEEDRIYGDGVNVAARLEALADPGGVCVSKTAFDQIETKLPLGYEYLGEQSVKNIPKPVGAYRVLMQPRVTVAEDPEKEKSANIRRKTIIVGAVAVFIVAVAVGIWQFYMRQPSVERAAVEKMAFPLPDKPSIAVLPFDNLSKDQSDAYIADGLSENIISSLSKIPQMLVIARNTTFVYKGKAVRVNQVAEELGVRYVLEGSVQKSEDKIRVIAQLIDAVSGHHLWSEKYDREVKDFFQLLDEITLKIVAALKVKLIWGGDVRTVSTNSFEAWSYKVKGSGHFQRFTKQDNLKARELYKQAIKIDPEYVGAWTMLGWTHFSDARNAFTDTPSESVKQAVLTAQKASGIDDREPDLQNLWASLYLIQRQHEKAIAAGQNSIELDANFADSYALLAQIMYYSGRSDEAITLMQHAMRLSPYPPAYYLIFLGWAYQGAGRYQESLPVFQKFFERSQKGEFSPIFAHNLLTCIYALMGEYDKAHEHWAEVLKIYPDASLEWIRSFHFFKDPDQLEHLLDAYRAAGISEHPPLKLPDKPSIAVLPFRNLSGDPQQEFLSDGFTEDIITALAKIPRMFVIARESSFTYKDKSAKIQDVGRDLGVRYVLQGSIQKSGERVRISTQLIDAKNGHHLWAEKFDRDQQNIFKLRDDIIKEIAIALQVKLADGEWLAGWMGITNNFDAWLKVKQSLEHFRRFTPDDNILSRQKAKEALKLDPNYSGAMQMIAWTLLMDGLFGTSKIPEKSIEQAFELAQKALDNGDDDAGAHYLLGYAYSQRGQFEKAVSELEIACDLFPNSAEINAGLGMVLSDAGRPLEAIPVFKKAMRLNPIPPSWYFDNLGTAYRNTEQYEKATLEYKKAIQQQPDHLFAHLSLAVCYVRLNRQEDAHAEAAEVLRIDPKFSMDRFTKNLRIKDQAAKQRHIDGMHKLGLPE